MKNAFMLLILLLFVSCSKTPSEQIIDYAKEKYGNQFKEGAIDLKDVFKFKWQKLYIFSPLMYPEDITKEIGFEYRGDIVPDDNYLFLFIDEHKIVKQYVYSNIQIGFDDDKRMGVYKIQHQDGKYLIKFLKRTNYWLYKIK